MQLVPQPWFLIPDDATVLAGDGRQLSVAEHGRPLDLTTFALRCVFTDDELLARALVVLTTVFGPLTSHPDPM